MNILMVVPWIPFPPTDGGRVRSYYLLREIARRHTVSLFCVRNPGEDIAGLEQIKPWCQRVEWAPSKLDYSMASKVRSMVRPLPFGEIDPDGEAAQRLLALGAADGTDLLHIQGIEFAKCLPLLRRTHRLVFDMVDCNSVQMRRRAKQVLHPVRRLWYLAQAAKYAQAERALLARPLVVTLSSPADAEALLSHPHDAGVKMTVIPNGVDVTAARALQTAFEPPRLVFTGNMGYFPNDDAVRYFCREILPLIRRQRADMGVDMIGKNPSADLVQFCRRQADVAVLGFVPDVKAEVIRRTLFVCPLRIGTGIKLKLLEAMAWGMPIVATSLSVEGMPVEDGRHLLIARSPAEFAAKVLKALGSPELRARLGAEALNLMKAQYSWQAIGDQLDAVYREVMS